MAKAEVSVEDLLGMIERGELRLPEMQRVMSGDLLFRTPINSDSKEILWHQSSRNT